MAFLQKVISWFDRFRAYAFVLVLSLLCAAAVLLLRPPDGGVSVLAPILFLPLMLAILTCPYRFGLSLSLLLGLISIVSAFSPDESVSVQVFAHPDGQTALLRALLLVSLGALGGGYVQHLQQERESLTRQLQEADELLRVSSRVGTTGRLEDAIEIVLMAVHQQYHYRVAGVLLWEENARQLILYGNQDRNGLLPITRTSFELEGSLSGDLWNSPYYHPNVNNALPTPLDLVAAGSRSLAMLPMPLPGNRFVGALVVGFDEADSLSTEDMEWLSTFAQGIALPLNRTRAHEELEHLAYTDSMTGLSNYRAFRAHLHEEFVRARRYQHPLAMLMVDVDFFKKVNDQYGHPAGDAVLRHLAGLLRIHLRTTDIPARYGGEEFVVLCLETDEAEAVAVAERVRSAVESGRCLLPDGREIAYTISIGAAVFPDVAQEDSELVAQADSALYQAKQSGRNRVVCAKKGAK